MTETPPDDPLVEVLLASIVTRQNSPQQLIKLKEKDGPRTFPIVIGVPEAAEMRRVVKQVETERPMTHELLVAAVEALGGQLERVDIVDLRNHTFFARLVLSKDGGEEQVVVDARPSDAIALALRAGATLSVAQSVLEEARIDVSEDELEEGVEDEGDDADDGDAESNGGSEDEDDDA